MTDLFGLTTRYRRIDEITGVQFPVFMQTNLSAGDLLVLSSPDEDCSEALNIIFIYYLASTLLQLLGPPTVVERQGSIFSSAVPHLLLQHRITRFLHP